LLFGTKILTGDTESVGNYKNEMIEVLLPECVKANPQKDHGKGEPFLNLLDNISQNSNSALEAELLTMATTIKN